MNTWHIHIEGQVQGVGFRPFVYQLARKIGLNGWVNNTVDGVHVSFNADQATALAFKRQLEEQAPRLSKITSSELTQIPQTFFDNFQIIHSNDEGAPKLLLTPDFAICSDCRSELHNPLNRRFAYPFITCTNCGPRFSIIRQLPYDRPRTTMDAFPMCDDCMEEYQNPEDRRYYSQTNSCETCGIQLSLFDAAGKQLDLPSDAIIDQVVRLWEAGNIVAIKGIGGYLLTCDAQHSEAIKELRHRKFRPSKPFALMVPRGDISAHFQLTEEMWKELQNEVSPIILLEQKESADILEEIAPGLDQIGVMVPYTPLYELLIQRFGKAIVATSGNISQSPIVFEDSKALTELSKVADYLLVNNREIVIPQDDSVIRYSPFYRQRIILRRSRGLAPTYINPHIKWSDQKTLGMGAMLKSSFSLIHQGNVYISQYLGNLEHFDTLQHYQKTLQHFLTLFHFQPSKILCDQHPGYASTQYGQALAEEQKVPVQMIQHHLAHFGAILGEHNLLEASTPILGVIWDGTGLGDDGQIWGGEFFLYRNRTFERSSHFEYFDFILGDKMPKEPRISALSACWGIHGAEVHLESKFTSTEWKIYQKLLQRDSRLKTSSVGRLFDAVAALLNLADTQTYEGEAAMRLEAIATSYFRQSGLDMNEWYSSVDQFENVVSTKAILRGILSDLEEGKASDFIAAKFHFSLIQLLKQLANNLNVKQIAFSGGVFQNGLLIDLIQHHLGDHYTLYFHQQLSPNDENISFGQLVINQIGINRKIEPHVFSNTRKNQIH